MNDENANNSAVENSNRSSSPIKSEAASNREASAATEESERLDITSLDSFSLQEPSYEPPKHPPYYWDQSMSRRGNNKAGLVQITSYPSANHRPIPSKLEFLKSQSSTHIDTSKSEVDSKKQQLHSELTQTLSRSNLKQKASSETDTTTNNNNTITLSPREIHDPSAVNSLAIKFGSPSYSVSNTPPKVTVNSTGTPAPRVNGFRPASSAKLNGTLNLNKKVASLNSTSGSSPVRNQNGYASPNSGLSPSSTLKKQNGYYSPGIATPLSGSSGASSPTASLKKQNGYSSFGPSRSSSSASSSTSVSFRYYNSPTEDLQIIDNKVKINVKSKPLSHQ